MESTTENKIKVSTLEYVDFNDIEEFICKELGIERKYFRDYHKVIGGDYKDLWHVWLKLVGGDVSNGGYHTIYLDGFMDSYYYEQTLKTHGDWIKCLRKPLEKLQEQLGEDIVVYYSW